MTKDEKPNEKITNFITKDIEKKLLKNECLNTGKVWKRNCPNCGEEQLYNRKDHWKNANKRNVKCKSCRHTKLPILDEYVRKCINCSSKIKYKSKGAYYTALKIGGICRKCSQIGKIISEQTKLKISSARKGKGHPHTVEHKEKMLGEGNPMYDVHRYGKLNPFSGKKHTEESRKKMRVAMLSKIKERYGNGFLANVGTKESSFLEKLEKERNWNGIYYGKSKTPITLKEAIGDLPSLEPQSSSSFAFHSCPVHNDRHILWMSHTPTGKSAFENVGVNEYYPQKADGTTIKGFKNTYKRMSWDEPAPTVTMNNGCLSSQNTVHPGRPKKDGTYSDARVLTIKELMILTGLDDNWKWGEHTNQRPKNSVIRDVLGEAVPPQLIYHLTKPLKNL